VDVFVDPLDPAGGDHVVLHAGAEVQLGQFDLGIADMVDLADVLAVRAEDFHVFADGASVLLHGVAPLVGLSGAKPDAALLRSGAFMAEIINLNRARKDRAAAEKKARAGANRARHGRTRGEISLNDAEKNQMKDKLDAHRIGGDDEPEPA
jgi:hypothetical protein